MTPAADTTRAGDGAAAPPLRRPPNDEDEDEEEMISLGLSGEGSFKASGDIEGGGDDDDANGAPPTMMVGANRKSAFPATPAMAAGRMPQPRNGGDGGARPVRRTPGPPSMSVARQPRHRRTPGAGGDAQKDDYARSHHARTPVMSGGGSSRLGKTPHKQTPLSSSSLVTPMNKSQANQHSVETPNMINANLIRNGSSMSDYGQRQLYTPAHFTLAKNADLHMDNSRPDAFSPATIRMTDSLEKILTDDDDYMDVRQRARLARQEEQAQVQHEDGANEHPQPMDNTVMFNAPYSPTKSQEDIAGSRGAFIRIQSSGTATDEDSDDQEMDEMNDIGRDDEDSEEEEEEAEISQINDDVSDEEVDAGDAPLTRPQPLNLSGGVFKPTPKKPTVQRAPPKSVTKPGPLRTPKPQRTMPRPAAPTYHDAQGGRGGQHPNQAQGGSMYYPQQQQQPQQHQGYFGQMGPPGPFHHEQHPPSYQYPHTPLQPSPHPQYGPQPHYHHQTFHPPAMPSPNPGYALPSGMVSPLTLPTEYPGVAADPHYLHSPGTYHQHNQHSVHAIPPEFGSNQGPGAGGDPWAWRRDGALHSDHGGFDPGMHPGMHHVPGHASPDFSYHHELSGAASPFTLPTMPHHHYPATAHHPPPHSNHYPAPRHQSQGRTPVIHHPTATRQRTSSKDKGRPGSHRKPGSSSPSQQSSPGRKLPQRPRKDSAASINSANSTFSAGEELGLSTSLNQTTLSSLSASSSTSVLKQSYPGIVHSLSSEEQEQGDWFYPSTNPNISGASFSTMGSGSVGGAYSKQINTGHMKKKGSYESMGAAGTIMQNISNSGGTRSLSAGDGKKGGKKSLSKQQRKQHQTLPHLDAMRTRRGGVYPDNVIKQHQERSGEPLVLESPTERQAFKEFGRVFRQKENESLDAARDYALACLDMDRHPGIYLPPATHWRVFLELADVAKRSNKIDDARANYRQACVLQPRASQGWLEHSKLEEESGNIEKCAEILQEGLKHCDIQSSESLLIRALKFYERVGKLDEARALLSRLKHLSIDKSWKIMLEGALLEARAGRYPLAREVLKYLTHYVPWYGPLYLAHTKLERDFGSLSEAFSIVEKGLKELPRYGPLYFQAFRLLEKQDISLKAYDLPLTMEMISRADWISRELLWKVNLEAAQMQERAAALAVEGNAKLALQTALRPTRRSYAKAIMLCPPNLSWKIWLASGRTEVSCGNTKGARELFLRAYDSVSEKGRSTVLLECARLEEFVGDLALSRSILCKARNLFGKSDWKVWLSSVNLESRCGLRERAIAFAQEALNMHRGTGRLWAALIQLRHDDGEMYQMKVLKCALQAVPKSGEVWCEGARIYLNPCSPTFDLRAASRHLSFAARFTPQYGDSFLEQLRLSMIDQWLVPLATPFINSMYDAFLSHERMQTKDAHQMIADHTKKAADVVKTRLERKDDLVRRDVLDTSELELRCSSADPNYGHLWFKCRKSPVDTAREVIAKAKDVMAESVINYSYLYIAAMVRRAGVLILIHHQAVDPDAEQKLPEGLPHPNSSAWDVIVDRQLRLAPALDEMLSTSISGKMFTREDNLEWDKLSLSEKQTLLFGSDSLLS